MRSREALVVLILLAPLAGAHAGEMPESYNPLNLDLHTFLSGDGRLVAEQPPEGAVHFPARQPDAEPTPLVFVTDAPVRFVPVRGLSVSVAVAADTPLAGRDASGNSLRFQLLRNGTPVDGAEASVALPPVLVPGSVARAEAVLQAPSTTFSEGDRIALTVTPLMPVVPEEGLRLLVGASVANFETIRVPAVEDLRLGTQGRVVFLLQEATFGSSEPDAVVHTARVLHDRVDLPSARQPAGTTAYVVFRGEETVEDAYAHHHFPDAARRHAAAHEFLVGDRRVLVHPGVGVVVPVRLDAPGVVDVVCGANCPQPGWSARLNFTAPEDLRPAPGGGGSIVPPPRDTSGVPVSKDAPPEAQRTPLGLLVPIAALALAVMGSRRR